MPFRMERRSVHEREPEPGLLDPILGGGNGNGILGPIVNPILGNSPSSNPPAAPAPAPTTTNTPNPQPTQAPTTTNHGGGTPPTTTAQPNPAPPQSTPGQTQQTSTADNETPDTPSAPPDSVPTGGGSLSDGVGNAADGDDTGDNGDDSKGNTAGGGAKGGDASGDKTSTAKDTSSDGTATKGASTPGGSSSGTNTILLPGQSDTNGSGGGGSGGDVSVAGSSPTSSSSSGGAKPGSINGGIVGGVVAAILVVVGIAFLLFFRKRHTQRRHERRVTWMTGTVGSPEHDKDMAQLRGSMRSSWGTPVERRVSEVAPWVSPPPSTEGHGDPVTHANFVVPSSAPILPMPRPIPPVVSVTPAHSPENPFADEQQYSRAASSAAASGQPSKRLSSLPIRISLLSTGSGSQSLDPFDDVNEILAGISGAGPGSGPGPGPTPADMALAVTAARRASAATFGHNTSSYPSAPPSSQANFPMPPSSSHASTPTQAVFAYSHNHSHANTPSPDHLRTPVLPMAAAFPDSPVSPTFGSNGAVSSYRRASVKSGFQPSVERRDELLLEPGDRVNVVSVYEDGWAFVQRERNAERGLVPLTCLQLDDPQAM